MRTRSGLLGVLLLIAWPLTIPTSSPAAEVVRESFKVASGDRFLLQHPEGWKSESTSAEGAPVSTFRLVNAASTSVLLISVIPAKEGGDLEEMEDLEKLLVLGTKGIVRNSVEGKLSPLSFRSEFAYGVYAALSDNRFQPPAAPPEGEYRHSATYILNCSHRAVVATFLTNENRAPSIDLSLLILRTLRLDPDIKGVQAARKG